jgi:DNA-binding transcriptional MerR regulator
MRIGELATRAGLPKSTIHFYLREGLLPPPDKPTANSAVYSGDHLERLKLIKKLRSEVLGPLPVPQVRRVLQLLDRGVSLELAVGLQRAVLGGQPAADGLCFDAKRLAQEAGMDIATVRKLVDAGVLLPAPSNAKRPFDTDDVHAAKALSRVLSDTSISIDDLARGARKTRELSRYEVSLRNRAVADLGPEARARVSLMLQEVDNVLRRYLFLRARQHDIVELADAPEASPYGTSKPKKGKRHVGRT